MTKYRKLPLAMFLSVLILFSTSIFLYSCGVSSPTSSTGAAGPTAMKPSAFGATGTYNLYVANALSHSIGIINPNTSTSTTFQTVGSYPVSMAFNMTLNRLYVVNAISNDIAVFDATTNAPITNIPVGRNPINLAIDPNTNKIYVLNGGGSGGTKCTVSIIDPVTNTAIASKTVTVGGVGAIVINPRTHKAYITSHGFISGQIFVLDTITDTLLPPITFPNSQNPFGIAIAPTASRAYVTMTNTDEVGIIDTATDTYIGSIPITLGKTKSGIIAAAPYAIAIDPVSNKAYVANKWSDTVSILDLSRGSEIKALPVGSISGLVLTYTNDLIAVDTSSNRVYVSNTNSNNITVIDTTTDTVMGNIPTGVNPSGLALALPFNVTPVTPPPVVTPPPPVNKTLASLNIQPKTASISVGAIYPFVVSGVYSDGSPAGDLTTQATWSTGNPAIATASPSGIIMGIASGTTTVKATYSGLSDSASISVSATKPYKIMIASTTTTIGINGTASFTARAYYGTNSIDITTNASISWTSSNPTVATINNQGIATGKVIGVTNISATYDGLASTNTIPLTVTVPKLTKIDITPLDFSANSLTIVQYRAIGTFGNAGQTTQRDITNDVNWSSSDTNIAQLTFLSPFLTMIYGGSSYQNAIGAFAVTGTGGTSTIITAASTTPAGTIQATTTLSVNGGHYRQNITTAQENILTTAWNKYKNAPDPYMTKVSKWLQDPDVQKVKAIIWWESDPYGNNWDDADNNLGPRYEDPGSTSPVLPQILVQTGKYNPNMYWYGCHTVSAAMVLTKAMKQRVDPRLLNNYLHGNNGYTPPPNTNGPVWFQIKAYAGSAIVAYTNEIPIQDATKGISQVGSFAAIDNALQNNKMVIIRVHGQGNSFASHYVVVAGGSNGNYTIYDPWIRDTDKQQEQITDMNVHYHFAPDATYNVITIQ